MKKSYAVGLSALALVLLGALAVGVFTGPQRALMSARTALAGNDIATLEKHIDFPAVREQVKAQIWAELMASSQKEGKVNEGEMAGAALGMALVGPMLDAMITPQALVALSPDTDKVGLLSTTWKEDLDIETSFKSLSQSEVTLSKKSSDESIVFIMTRVFDLL